MKPYSIIFTVITALFSFTTNGQSLKSEMILGKWIVVESNILPFDHISGCKKIGLKTIFEFQKLKLSVFKNLNETPCSSNQTFQIYGDKLEIIESDMNFNYQIIELTNDTLKLKISRVPSYFWTELNLSDPKVQSDLKEIETNGINLTLKKIK